MTETVPMGEPVSTVRSPVLAMEGIQHAYHRTVALRGVSLRIGAGETVAITGPSGCGKSTLLHVAAGLIRPSSGSVALLGTDLAGLDDDARAKLRRSRLSLVLQFGQLVSELSGADNVALPLLLDGHERAGARRLAVEYLDRCGAADLANVEPAEMSGGQMQRVAVARALITGPQLVLADEPTGSLDQLGGRQLLDLLLEQCARLSAALVVVTHDNQVAARTEREIRLVDGAIVSDSALTA